MTARFPRARRALGWLATLGAVVVLAGATYQGVMTALERRGVPRPGHLVDVGGHQLHLYCTGDGAPTVVLEAPGLGLSAAWGGMQPRLAVVTRTCSYDRAGLGWSEAGDGRYDPARVPDELRALLEAAHERAPFILVGQGLGADLAHLSAARFGSDAVGLIAIRDGGDPSAAEGRYGALRFAALLPWLARAGILRVSGVLATRAEGLPDSSAAAMRAFMNRPDHVARSVTEFADQDEAKAIALATPLPPDLYRRSITVASRASLREGSEDQQRALAAILDGVHAARVIPQPAPRAVQSGAHSLGYPR